MSLVNLAVSQFPLCAACAYLSTCNTIFLGLELFTKKQDGILIFLNLILLNKFLVTRRGA